MARGRKSNATKAKVKATAAAKKSTSTKNMNSTDSMKYEIAKEFGVKLGATASAQDNGRVGGEMTKRLVQKAKKNK